MRSAGLPIEVLIKYVGLVQQGKVDRIVPAEQARFLRDALVEAGHRDGTLIEYPLLGHAFWFWIDSIF